MRTLSLGLLATTLVVVGSVHAQSPSDVCKPLRKESRVAQIRCIRDVNRMPFIQRHSMGAPVYDQYYSDLLVLAGNADRGAITPEQLSIENAKLRARFTVALQEADARALAGAKAEYEREIRKTEAYSRRQRAAQALIGFGAANRSQQVQPPAPIQTTCNTFLEDTITCTTR